MTSPAFTRYELGLMLKNENKLILYVFFPKKKLFKSAKI